jgi:hypothetical protein
MNEPSQRMNFNQHPKEELDTTHETRPDTGVVEFQTADELLRYDAARIEVPAGVAGRLAESAGNTPADPWWRRMFNG